MPNGLTHIVVTTSRETYRGTLDANRVKLDGAPGAVAQEIASQARDGQDRGQVTHNGQVWSWHTADNYEIREFRDGTWFVYDLVEKIKTHDGYFAARAEAEAELEAIFAEPAYAPAPAGWRAGAPSSRKVDRRGGPVDLSPAFGRS